MMRHGWILAAACVALGACGKRENVAERPQGQGAWSNARGFYAVWQPVDDGAPLDEVPLNEEFDVDVWLFTDETCATPLESTSIEIDCRMPAHGHGMLADVVLEPVGNGKHQGRGMLCHMGGHWELYIDRTRGAVTERAQFDIEIE